MIWTYPYKVSEYSLVESLIDCASCEHDLGYKNLFVAYRGAHISGSLSLLTEDTSGFSK